MTVLLVLGRNMKAIEKGREVSAIATLWQHAFRAGATVVGPLEGRDVLWHERLGIWGSFGKTRGKAGIERDWNPFGQKPVSFRSNIVVEINQPPAGIDRNVQAVFARDDAGNPWLLHQGRMSVSGSRVTEADFIAATTLKPIDVAFSDGSLGAYHKVVQLNLPASAVQKSISAFIARCAQARTFKLADGKPLPDLGQAQEWERGFTPEAIGAFQIGARDAQIGYRRHGAVQRALAAELARREKPHSNDRVGQYGPDLFTYGTGPKVLFEIKSGTSAGEVFAAVGQLHIYDRLLGGGYRKVLVVPAGIGEALKGPVAALGIDSVEYRREGQRIIFCSSSLSRCLADRDHGN